MHEMTSTTTERMKLTAEDVMIATFIANKLPLEICDQLPHTGRQSEVFPTTLQEKASWHLIVLQLSGWMLLYPLSKSKKEYVVVMTWLLAEMYKNTLPKQPWSASYSMLF